MPQNMFKSFAVLGAGTLGSPLAEARNLLRWPVFHSNVGYLGAGRVVVFTRPIHEHRKLPSGTIHVAVDFTDSAALTEHFRSHSREVVISAINYDHLDVHAHTLESAKNAGVKLYVPSEYGIPSEGQDGILGQKSDFVGQIKAAGIPYVRL